MIKEFEILNYLISIVLKIRLCKKKLVYAKFMQAEDKLRARLMLMSLVFT